MEFYVTIHELLDALKKNNVNFESETQAGKTFIDLHDSLFVGPPDSRGRVYTIHAIHEEQEITAVCLYMVSDSSETQAIWTNILYNGFLDLELYPIMIEDKSLPTKLFLAPIKY